MNEPHRGMQDKTIKKAMVKKLYNWIDSIDNDSVRTAVKKDTIVTGGSIASMAMGDPVNDYDIYFRTIETTKLVAECYADKACKSGLITDGSTVEVKVEEKTNIKGETELRVLSYIESSGVISIEPQSQEHEENGTVEEEDDDNYSVRFISENAITLSNSIQLITRFYGEPNKIHSNFDFIHAMCYFDLDKYELHMPVEAMRSMMSKTLQYKGSLYPICSLFRLRKFIKRGWNISAGQIFKIAHQISEIDLNDIDTLREQLTGVDQLYFNQLLIALHRDNVPLDSCYVAEVIDRMEF